MENYSDPNPWNWASNQQLNESNHSYPAAFDASMYTFTSAPPQSVQPRHHSVTTPHTVYSVPQARTRTKTPEAPRQHIAGSMVKAQPAFKPTWHGFLDTTKDAMTIVEAALQGRLSHISRRPHDKERAEMLTSGTVLVYEENASGIKRWTDAVHWSPSRVMNNCLIYRQLVRALKPEEKKAALNPSCGSKRKRKGSASPSVTNRGENIHNASDEYEHSTMGNLPEDVDPTEPFGKVYENFAQTLTPDQQRHYCGSLVDSYEFKEGGLMKKTISVKYQGTHHHIISYYSLEDVVSGKLKRPFQDPKLANIQPRPELLTGWKVSLEEEESKDMPLSAGYSQHLQPSLYQPAAASTVSHGLPAQTVVQIHAPLRLQAPADYWHGSHIQQYTPTHHTHQDYTPTHHATSPYTQQVSQQYPTHQTSVPQYHSQQPPAHQYPSEASPASHYPAQPSAAIARQYSPQPQVSQHYPSVAPNPPYSEQHATTQYPEAQHTTPVAQQPQYTPSLAQGGIHVYDLSMPAPQAHPPIHRATPSPHQHHDPNRRASAPVMLQSYGQPPSQPQYEAAVQPQTYYVPNQKFHPGGYGY